MELRDTFLIWLMTYKSYPDRGRCLRLYRIADGAGTLIGIQSPRDPIIEQLIEGQEGVFFSARYEMHMIRESQTTIRTLIDRFRGKIWVNMSHLRRFPQGELEIRPSSVKHRVLAPDKLEALDRLIRDLEVQRYSESTLKQYRSTLELFLKFFNERAIESLDIDDVMRYNKVMIIDQAKSASTQRQLTGVLKHFFSRIVGSAIDSTQLEYARKSSFLPSVLDKEEVMAMVRSARNDKHRVIILTLYAQGLRRQELVDLKLADIDLRRGMLHVRQGKGAKDRVLPLSKVLIKILRNYIEVYRPTEYLLMGQMGGKYSGTSIGKVVVDAARRAKILKHVTPHTLRHSYATHCLELGMGLRYIQDFLGHYSVKTTMRYTHIRNNKVHVNPLDELAKGMLDEGDYNTWVQKSDHIPPGDSDMIT